MTIKLKLIVSIKDALQTVILLSPDERQQTETIGLKAVGHSSYRMMVTIKNGCFS